MYSVESEVDALKSKANLLRTSTDTSTLKFWSCLCISSRFSGVASSLASLSPTTPTTYKETDATEGRASMDRLPLLASHALVECSVWRARPLAAFTPTRTPLDIPWLSGL